MANAISDYLLKMSERSPYASQAREGGSVYSLQGYGLDNYLLRVEGFRENWDYRNFKQKLEQTTSLTPVYLCEPEVGQPRLIGSGFQIISKVPGHSLNALFDERLQHHRELGQSMLSEQALFSAYRDVLRTLGDIPDKSIKELMQVINEMTAQGVAADPNWGNLLRDKKRLNIIDFIYPNASTNVAGGNVVASENNLARLEQGFLVREEGYETMPQAFPEEVQKIREKLNRAAQSANFPRNRRETSELMRELGGTPSGGLQSIEVSSGSSLPLSSGPKDMRKMLDEVKNYSVTSEAEHELRRPDNSPGDKKRGFFRNPFSER